MLCVERVRVCGQTNQLKCLDMEGKIARHEQQRRDLEAQVSSLWAPSHAASCSAHPRLACQLSDVERKLATEVKARHALQRQITQLTRDLSRQQTKERVIDDELASFAKQTEDQELRLAAETRGRKFFQGLLTECETKLAAVLAGSAMTSGRWDRAGSLIGDLLSSSRIGEEEVGFEDALLHMSDFISTEASSASIGVDPQEELQQQREQQQQQSPAALPQPREDPDLAVAMVLRNVVEAVVQSAE